MRCRGKHSWSWCEGIALVFFILPRWKTSSDKSSQDTAYVIFVKQKNTNQWCLHTVSSVEVDYAKIAYDKRNKKYTWITHRFQSTLGQWTTWCVANTTFISSISVWRVTEPSICIRCRIQKHNNHNVYDLSYDCDERDNHLTEFLRSGLLLANRAAEKFSIIQSKVGEDLKRVQEEMKHHHESSGRSIFVIACMFQWNRESHCPGYRIFNETNWRS